MLSPNLSDYQTEIRKFRWDQARSALSGLPQGGLNIAYEAVDRHVLTGKADQRALRWLGKNGQTVDLSFSDLSLSSHRFANVLKSLGLRKGDRVYSLLGRIPELYFSVFGTFMHQCIFCPLFSAFGPEPILSRMSIGEATVLVTTPEFYRKKVAPIRSQLPSLKHVLLVTAISENEKIENTLNLNELLESASDQYEIQPTDPEAPALYHFTSGTTGKPKGAVHVHQAILAHHTTGKLVLDFHEKDLFWCTADPGWVTGMSYGILSPLSNGVSSLIDEADFDLMRWLEILQKEKVSIWYTAPTAIRMMMRADPEIIRQRTFPDLRLIASVGEPLNPEAVYWSLKTFGLPIHDNWWQTETGGIMIANYLSMEIRPGSMGKPLPGIEAFIVERKPDGTVEILKEPNRQGELALKKGWPSMFRGYLYEEARYRKCFAGDLYLTGDLAKKDADGYFWFVGRADDVIKSSGHLIGPFEVESAIMEHPDVAEAGVIGKPDPMAGEIVKAFVVLKTGKIESEELKMSILALARKRLGPAVAPKEISFIRSLPKTRSGKIMRRLLKSGELGLPEGDTSMLETAL